MKTICLISLTVLLAIALANDSHSSLQAVGATASVKKEMNPRILKSTKAYREAKKACLKKSEGRLKGKQLTDCIVRYQKEAK